MLKAYCEKPKPELVTLNYKLGLENCTPVLVRNETHSEGCADLEAEKKEDTKSEVRLGNDQQLIKLQKQILNDLSTKLSHLPSAQREELAESVHGSISRCPK